MSKKTTKSGRTRERKEQEKGITVRPDYDYPYSTHYSNFASVSHTSEELTIDFCLIAPPHKIDASGNVLNAQMVVRVVVSTRMAEGLVNALTTRLERQKKESESERLALEVEVKSEN